MLSLGGGLAFASPWLLIGLAALPVLWWLLRLTPPSPKLIPFPAIRLLFGLIPFCYHTLLLSGPHHATLGMRLFGIEMRSIPIGYPDSIQAAIQTALFYISMGLTLWLLVLWALFDPRRRMLHDILAGTYVVNRRAALSLPP